jgi:hypothetical protein
MGRKRYLQARHVPRHRLNQLPPTHNGAWGGAKRVDGTLARTVWGYKAIDKLGHTFRAGLFNNDSHLSIKGVAVFSLSTTSEAGGEQAWPSIKPPLCSNVGNGISGFIAGLPSRPS